MECKHCANENKKNAFFCTSCEKIQKVNDDVSIFELLNIKPSIHVNKEELNKKYAELIQKMHPDKFTYAIEEDKNIAEANTAILNNAYKTLSCNESICEYLIHEMNKESSSEFIDNEYMMEVMMLNEELNNIRSLRDYEIFANKISNMHNMILSQMKNNIIRQNSIEAGKFSQRLKFINKILLDVNMKSSMLKQKELSKE